MTSREYEEILARVEFDAKAEKWVRRVLWAAAVFILWLLLEPSL